MKKSKITMLPFLMVFFSFCTPAVNRNFYKDYKSFRLRKDGRIANDNLRNRGLKMHIKRLKEGFQSVEAQTKESMLKQDTVFIFSTSYPGLGDTVIGSNLMWNKNQSCYYLQKVFPKGPWNQKQMHKVGHVKVPADSALKLLTPEFKTFTERADTIAFAQYMKTTHFSGDFTYSFIVAYRVDKHWKFITTPAYSTMPMRHY